MGRTAEKLGLLKVDELFTTQHEREEQHQEALQQIPLADLRSHGNNPFKVRHDEEMQELIESVKQSGVLSPGLARALPDGSYELISGHRRLYACQLAGLDAMPVIVREMNDDDAIITMVDCNLQREHISPSEKAFAYKLKLDATKRKAGRPSLENSAQLGQNLHGVISRTELAKNSPDSSGQIQRFIRLTNLEPELLNMVDDKKLSVNAAYELSFLSEHQQQALKEVMAYQDASPTINQAQRIRKYSQDDCLNKTVIDAIMSEEKPIEKKLVISGDTISKYFPPETTPQEMTDTIIKALKMYRKQEKIKEAKHVLQR